MGTKWVKLVNESGSVWVNAWHVVSVEQDGELVEVKLCNSTVWVVGSADEIVGWLA